MNLGIIFLNVNSSGIITLPEIEWIAKNQFQFNRIEESIALKLGDLIDCGIINFGCRLYN